MANLRIEGFDGVDKLFKDLSNIDEIAIEAVNEAAPILEECLKGAIEAAADKGYATGELVNSIIARPAKKNRYGVFSAVGPVGTHSKRLHEREETSYAKEAAILEFGRNGGYAYYDKNNECKMVTHQEPRPYRENAIKTAKTRCEETMEESVIRRLNEIII